MWAYVQLPYPGDVASDIARAGVTSVIVQNPAPEGGGLYPQCAEIVGTGVTVIVGSILSPTSGFTATVSMPTWAASSPYAGGMTDPAYRWRLIGEQRRVWDLWRQTFGRIDGFYISHEANLALWAGYTWAEPVRAGYEAVIVQTMRDAVARRPYTPLVWSPAVWPRWTTLSSSYRAQIVDAYRRTIDGARSWLRTHDLLNLWLSVELQDGVGANYDQGKTREDAAAAFNDLEMDAMNVEAFIHTGGSFLPAPDFEERLEWYKAQGIPVGTNFELRYIVA